ncbi:hypothetical protein [Natronolimnohabitans innermongolicus]|uniref:DUF8159 domain-containing protein n=1 Tax=Natronolimnohabitans innermongolicus JCM 12255 TaxID=1227499 RepID=L9WZE8_9EURY|nr:hypothetical protein [Natronolimnohabitans innermongolicus]ELY54869.1 hypothetical protein C493_12232 [Natronolimnohabitans innermongolicus JCM 12255]
MKRRLLLTAVAGAVVAGCVTESPDGGTGTDAGVSADSDAEDDGEPADEEPSEVSLLDAFESALEDGGLENVAVESVDDRVEIEYHATGVTEDDVAAEITLIADGYTTATEQGLSSTRLEATAIEPATDETLDRFSIEIEWIDAYLSDSIEWNELLMRIAETFVTETSSEDDAVVEDGSDDETEGGDDEGGESDESEESDGNETEQIDDADTDTE